LDISTLVDIDILSQLNSYKVDNFLL